MAVAVVPCAAAPAVIIILCVAQRDCTWNGDVVLGPIYSSILPAPRGGMRAASACCPNYIHPCC